MRLNHWLNGWRRTFGNRRSRRRSLPLRCTTPGEVLEDRLLLSAVHGTEQAELIWHLDAAGEESPESAPPILDNNGDEVIPPPSGTGGSTPPPAVPAFNSYPSGKATLFLDFDGHYESEWGGCGWGGLEPGKCYTNVWTPVFDFDDDPSSFSTGELNAIEEIWSRVAEDFAPFNINVTTVDPGSFADGEALKVAIGGSSWSWYDEPNPGVAWVNSFTNHLDNSVFVFASNYLQRDDATGAIIVPADFRKNVADAASHEAGHAFGLHHQSLFIDGYLVEEYRTGDSGGAGPIMGNHYASPRTIWWKGDAHRHGWPPPLDKITQDDMAVIARSKNGFGYRPDSHGGSDLYSAPALNVTGSIINSRGGIIERMSDVDYYSLTVSRRSEVAIRVDVLANGPNLDATLEIYSQSGSLVARSDYVDLNESIDIVLQPGAWYVVVRSAGNYGDVGQYWVSGTVVDAPPIYLENGVLHIDGTSDVEGLLVDDWASVAYDGSGLIVATLSKMDRYGKVARQWQETFNPADVDGIVFRGYDGPDRFYNQTGIRSTAWGGDGPDTLSGGSAADELFGDAGADWLYGNAGDDALDGGSGNDYLYGSYGNDTLEGGAGNDRLYGGADNDVLYGDVSWLERYWPAFGAGDTLDGGSGNDSLRGMGGADSLLGGYGDDTLRGGAGNDTVKGHAGNDVMYGDGGADWMHGGSNNDTLYGGAHNDTMYGGYGNDYLKGGSGHDRIDGQYGDDTLFGQSGDDRLYGHVGHDRLYGGSGADALDGYYGNDYLDGGGDGARDTLKGGPGGDTFVQYYKLHRKWLGDRWWYYYSAEDVILDFGRYDRIIERY